MYVVLTCASSWGWRTKERREGRAGKEYSCLFYARGARQVTCADGQSSHISLTDRYSTCLLSKYGEIAAPKWHLELAGIGLVQASGNGSSRPGSSYGDRSWERTTTVKDNKVHHRSTWKILLLTTPTHIGIRNKNGLYVVYSYTFSTAIDPLYHIANKPRGLKAARKLRNTRRDNRWVRFPLGLHCLHYSLILCMTVGRGGSFSRS
jgi:hypothetical protein